MKIKNRLQGKTALFLVLLGVGVLFSKRMIPSVNAAGTAAPAAVDRSFSKPQPPISLQLETVWVHETKTLVRLRFTPFLEASSVEVFVASGDDGAGEKMVLFKGAASKGVPREFTAEVNISNKATLVGGVSLVTPQGNKFTKVVSLPLQESGSSAAPAPLPKTTHDGEKAIEFLVR